MQWTSLHVFYHDQERWDELLVYIFRIVKEKFDNPETPFFFIRYWEGGPHLRFRFLNMSTKDNQIFKSEVNHFFRNYPSQYDLDKEKFYYVYQKELNLQTSNLPWYPNHSIQTIPYKREVNRYNGNKVMKLSEKQFELSSKYILNRMTNFNIGKFELAFQSICRMIKSMGFTLQEEIDFLRSYSLGTLRTYKETETMKYIEKFESLLFKHEIAVRKALEVYWVNEKHIEDPFYSQYVLLRKEIEKHINKNQFKFNQLKIPSTKQWTNFKKGIGQTYWSWIHMHCNRIGVTPLIEAQIAFLISRGLKQMEDIL